MRKLTLLVSLILFTTQFLSAGGGMWLPLLLKQLNESEMQEMGMKMSAEDIYSINQGSLKDAIVLFGRGCTGELISDKGLLLTNHHCGYGTIQSHSSLENNYIDDGFWASSYSEELSNPGLTVTFLIRMEDVTSTILEGVTEEMTDKERQSQIDKNSHALKLTYELPEYEDIVIEPFYKGNEYYLLHNITYSDVRLVGAPPSSIGKFGADTDNWEWPRHTGDFSLFRIYAGPDNKPAEYSEENVPFVPKHFLPVSLDGVKPGEFTMIFGYPAYTDEYLPAVAVEEVIEEVNPPKIEIRTRALAIMDTDMKADDETRIKYVSKYAGVANGWKKWKGESLGLQRTSAVAKKQKFETEFQKRLELKPVLGEKYAHLLNDFDELYKKRAAYAGASAMYSELTRVVEAFTFSSVLSRLVGIYKNNGEERYNELKPRYISWLQGKYKNLNPGTDQKVLSDILSYYLDNVPEELMPGIKDSLMIGDGVNFGESILYDEKGLIAAIEEGPEKLVNSLEADQLYNTYNTITDLHNENVARPYSEADMPRQRLQRNYMKAIREVFPEQVFFPDANFTLRVSYGKVEGYYPRDGITYTPFTHLSGVMEKYKPGDYEFDVPKKLRELYNNKDYGKYGVDGKMPVCFLGSNHTTGGNSGSPVIDAYGSLIGINFDRVWEGTMSDINYDPSICRNIMVDIRYILFIIDKYAGATHLIDEMTIMDK